MRLFECSPAGALQPFREVLARNGSLQDRRELGMGERQRIGCGFHSLRKPANQWHLACNSRARLSSSNETGFYIDFGSCAPEGFIDINIFDAFLQSTILPALGTFGVGPKILPLFLFENVVMFDSSAANCCILGYHNAFMNQHGVPQTYSVANYDSNGAFPTAPDTVVLSHEIAEWLDDPLVNNDTPAWGNIGQVAGCQANLEVGDPLSGTLFSIPTPGFTYHVQHLAFKSWFYHDDPSSGVNG
jgi:hypothetical protein